MARQDQEAGLPRSLDLGCGNRKRPGCLGVDINPRSDADVVHDLDDLPYPFEDSYFAEAYADNVLEHLEDVVGVLEELHRICAPQATIRIAVPYFRSHWAFIDPTHHHFFTVQSFSYFDPDHEHSRLYRYSDARFAVERIVFNEAIRSKWPKRVVTWAANRWPVRYESYLSHLLPLDELVFYLRVIK